MSTEQATENRASLIYAGDRVGDKSSRRQFWLDYDGLENDGTNFPDLFENNERVHLYKGLRKHVLVGEIYSFVRSDPNKPWLLSMSNAKWVGRWQNNEDVALWRAHDIATDAELEARKKSKQDDLLQQLEIFRTTYKRLGSLQRAQFLAKIVHYIVH